MSQVSIDGYNLPIFPLDVANLVEGNTVNISLKRRMGDYDDGSPLALLTGTKEGRTVQYNLYLNHAELLNLQRFFTRELYFNVKRAVGTSFEYIDPDMPIVPANISDLKLEDPAILRRGLSQGTSMFQMFDPVDGIFKKYKLASDPQEVFKFNKNHVNFQLYEMGLADCVLKITIDDPTGNIPSGLPIANEGAIDVTDTLLELYYKGELYQTVDAPPNSITSLATKPSAYYTAKYRDITYNLPTISLESDIIEVDFENIGTSGVRVQVKDTNGVLVAGAGINGTFSLPIYDFTNCNYSDFGAYYPDLPFTLATPFYGISKIISDAVALVEFVLPTVTFIFKDALNNTRTSTVNMDGSLLTKNVVPTGFHSYKPNSYNLSTKSGIIAEAETQFYQWIIPTITATWLGVGGDAFGTTIAYNGSNYGIVYSPYSFAVPVGSNTVSLPLYNLTHTIVAVEGTAHSTHFVIPRVTYNWVNGFGESAVASFYYDGAPTGDSTSPNVRYTSAGTHTGSLPNFNITDTFTIAEGEDLTRNLVVPAFRISAIYSKNANINPIGIKLYMDGFIILNVTDTLNSFAGHEAIGEVHTYAANVETDYGIKTCLSQTYTYSAVNVANEREFAAPVIELAKVQVKSVDFANLDGIDVPVEFAESGGGVAITTTYQLTLEGSSYQILVNGDTWYYTTAAPAIDSKLFFVAPGTVSVTLDGTLESVSIMEGEFRGVYINV